METEAEYLLCRLLSNRKYVFPTCIYLCPMLNLQLGASGEVVFLRVRPSTSGEATTINSNKDNARKYVETVHLKSRQRFFFFFLGPTTKIKSLEDINTVRETNTREQI